MDSTDNTSGDTEAQDSGAQGIEARINRMIALEMAGLDPQARSDGMLLQDFDALREPMPHPQEVLFGGGTVQTCWRVTRSNGAYSLIYLPTAGYFSLCVDSVFGPVDIGVHGPALQCFASV